MFISSSLHLNTILDDIILVLVFLSNNAEVVSSRQNVKGNVTAAIHADSADGGMSGIQQLEDVVTCGCERLLLDSKTPLLEKLKSWSGSVRDWLVSEPKHPFRDCDVDKQGDVTKHATFRRLKAQICVNSCSCAHHQTNDKCSLHGSEIALSDLVWEVTSVVHSVFNDNFMAFVITALDATTQGV